MNSTATSIPASARNLERYLQVLTGAHPAAGLLELRFALSDGGMGQTFISARCPRRAARLIGRLAPRTDVYVGVALRVRRAGGRGAVDRSHLVFVEIDSADGEQRQQAFSKPPTMLVSSGTPGHVHAYWGLRTPVGVAELEHANRRLAHHLSGDLASIDAARILRPPQSRNHKHTPPTPVRLISIRPARRYELSELIDGLPDPPRRPSRSRSGPRAIHHSLDRALLAIPAAEYAAALAGLKATRAGKVSCPFHADQTPSLQLYQDGSWYCFGCRQEAASMTSPPCYGLLAPRTARFWSCALASPRSSPSPRPRSRARAIYRVARVRPGR